LTSVKTLVIQVGIKIVSENAHVLKEVKDKELENLNGAEAREGLFNVIKESGLAVTGQGLSMEIPSDAPSSSLSSEPSHKPSLRLSNRPLLSLLPSRQFFSTMLQSL